MDIKHKLSQLRFFHIRHWFYLRQAMRLHVKIRDPEDGLRYRFVADSLHAFQRGKWLLTKEPDMIVWLNEQLRPDDVFLDIGANVGTFSIFAAMHLSEKGHVYSCEPHLPTAVQLMQNVAANNLGDRVSVISAAVSGEDSFVPFSYKRWREGASGSQLGIEGGVDLEKPVGTELKMGLRVDTMIERGLIPPPNLIKIDTDGIELPITRGMKNLLCGENRPRSLMVEVQEGELTEQKAFMKECGYDMVSHRLARKAQRLFKKGTPLEELAFNAYFEPEG